VKWILSYLEEFTGVLVDVVDADAASEDADVEADAEIGGQHGEAGAVLLEDHLALEEDALKERERKRETASDTGVK
jgi:hypothetical protein